MDRRTFLKAVPALTVLAARASSLAQQAASTSGATQGSGSVARSTEGAVQASRPAVDLQPITLVKPQRDGGKSVLASLWERKTIRNISDKKLPPQVLSDLLWGAWGVNRDGGPAGRIGRTAASASNSQEIDLYVVLPEGVVI